MTPENAVNPYLYSARREKARALLAEKKLGALLVNLDANRYYLSGFELHDPQTNESCGCLLLMADGKDWLCTDARYEEAAKALWDEELILIYAGAASAPLRINRLLRGILRGELGFEAHSLSLAFYEDLSVGLRMKKADGLVESLRIIKDETEIALISASTALNHKLMEWIPGRLSIGKSEKQIAWEVEQFFRGLGAEELSFKTIAAIDANAALPHALPGESRVRENCCVLLDCGCRLRDYCSDQTRTFWVGGDPPDYFMRALEQVKEAQRLAIAAIRPGLPCKEVHAAAHDYFDRLGVAGHFNHGLGHGIGLQTHEAPSLNEKSETILRPGMIVSVEPGLYYPAWGGVRWEYLALVTEDGCRVL
ncbi:MAG: Xaa-Pro peptidase family protein [Deltaproteobacteria bacterium]|jgi:Xaa-Pro aminopeptidase|nr:Xaa-Pro peptidase family protein [Deltaproteobacteria bacterium]